MFVEQPVAKPVGLLNTTPDCPSLSQSSPQLLHLLGHLVNLGHRGRRSCTNLNRWEGEGKQGKIRKTRKSMPFLDSAAGSDLRGGGVAEPRKWSCFITCFRGNKMFGLISLAHIGKPQLFHISDLPKKATLRYKSIKSAAPTKLNGITTRSKFNL